MIMIVKKRKRINPRSVELLGVLAVIRQPPATDNSNNRGKFPLTRDFIRLWTDCFLSSACRKCVCCSSSVCFEGFPFLRSVNSHNSYHQSFCYIFCVRVCGEGGGLAIPNVSQLYIRHAAKATSFEGFRATLPPMAAISLMINSGQIL